MHKNRAVIACAGSGKTSFIVDRAVELTNQKTLVVTYTTENVEELRRQFCRAVRCVPHHVRILSWYRFLLHDGVRPYQNQLAPQQRRVRGLCFPEKPIRGLKKASYFTQTGDILRDKTSEFVCDCNRQSGGLVIKRLEGIYDNIFVDEAQDLAGYDLDFLCDLFKSRIAVTVVCDPRQSTFRTNYALKNSQYGGSAIGDWLEKRKHAGEIEIQYRSECYRSNQAICDLADGLYPALPRTVSKNTLTTGHDGVFEVAEADAIAYFKTHSPVVLRYSQKSQRPGLPAINMGNSKGRTFDRVMILPTGPMLAYWRTRDPKKAGDLAKFYVALTRARHSVAFVVPEPHARRNQGTDGRERLRRNDGGNGWQGHEGLPEN